MDKWLVKSRSYSNSFTQKVSGIEDTKDEHGTMPEFPVEWAAVAYKMLGFKAPLEVFYATDMRCAKLRICIREIYFNIIEREANAILDTKNF